MGRSTVPVEIEFVERVAVPVRVGGSLWGALALVAGHPIEAGAEERIAKFAGLVALAIAESDARAAARRRVAQQAAVNELSALALAGTPIDGLLDAAMQRVVDVLAAPSATLVQSLGAGEAVIRAAAGEATAAGTRFAVAPDTVEGAALAAGASLIVEDFAADARFAEGPVTTRAGMTGAAACPIRLPDRLWGAVCVFTARRRQFTADDVGFLESVANMLGSAIERATAEETIRHQALHDALTGIPNRTLLVDRLEQALERAGRTDTLVGVLYIDLDRFQDVNDTYGHPTGDALLIAVAEELSAAIRPGDTIARIGGDEFAVVAEGLVAPEEALALGDRLLRALHDPKAGLSGASVGVAVRRHGDSPSDAMRDADTALYRAKAAGRGRIELFDNEMRARMLDRLRTEADLTEALERNQLELFYQPIVSLVDGSITGLEGLIRWRHPTRGLIPPVAFVPIAEETNAIIDIGRFVIARACADAARWNARDTGDRTLAISVNLSPLQLADVGLPEFVATSIAASGIAPAQLGLEITESAVLDDDPSHAALLLELKRLGVQLVLDDFGTGYSSLSHLRRVPLTCVKLDRSFVSGIGTDDRATAIVVAVRQLARALGLVVIAEGVETADQVAALQGIGCELAQGYYFARPMERDRIDALLDAGEPWRLETALPAGDD